MSRLLTRGILAQQGANLVQASAPSIADIVTSLITDVGFTVSANINPNGAETTVTIEYGLTNAYGSTQSTVTGSPVSETGEISAAISGLTSNTTYHFRIKAVNSKGTTYSSDATQLTEKSWSEKMLDSYVVLNPEQAQFFDTTVVANDAERRALTPAHGDWCHVTATNRYWSYDANVALWHDTTIQNPAAITGSAGLACKNELINRLAEGSYLHTTYGPSGQNRTSCDFMYILWLSSNATSKTVNQSLRWDLDGTVITQTNFPGYTIGTNKGFVSFSADSFTLTEFLMNLFNIGGGCPNFNFPNILKLNLYGLMSGICPNFFTRSNTLEFALYSTHFIGDAPVISMKAGAITFSAYFSSVSGILDYMYANRASYTAITPSLSMSNVNIAQPEPRSKTALQSYTDGDTGTGKYIIHVLKNDPLAEGFKKWNITYNQTSEGIDKSILMIHLDDGRATQYSVAKDYFTSKGVIPTLYDTTGKVGTAGYVTLAQLQELKAIGWDIQDHTVSHPYLTTLNETQILEQLTGVETYFAANSLGTPQHIAYPYNANNLLVRTTCATRRLTGRTSSAMPFYKNIDKFQLGSWDAAVRTLDDLRVLRDKLKLLNHPAYSPCYMALYTHEVVSGGLNDDPGINDATTTGVLDEVIATVNSIGGEFNTISELYALLNP